IPFIVIFNLLDKPKWLVKSFNYIGGHSTNLWLTHMFFYMIYFKQLVFAPKNPILIFMWLVVLCLGTSHFIQWLDRKVMSLKTSK
ncbi:MAG: acyltransferase family protein, partial [Culicoidibacterales bacterium]